MECYSNISNNFSNYCYTHFIRDTADASSVPIEVQNMILHQRLFKVVFFQKEIPSRLFRYLIKHFLGYVLEEFIGTYLE